MVPLTRRSFLVLTAGIASGWLQSANAGKRVGIIGLDSSHCLAFSRLLNDPLRGDEFGNYKVVAAYPFGSFNTGAIRAVQGSAERIKTNTDAMRQMQVEIVDSITVLINKCDVFLLLTNDGRLHLTQFASLVATRKPVYIDKPVAASLADAMEIYRLAKQHGTPVFSSSALRFHSVAQRVVSKRTEIPVLGAEVFSPAHFEATHPGLFWYGIHGVELLLTLMGGTCTELCLNRSDNTDMVVARWKDGRFGVYRGLRTRNARFGGHVHTQEGSLGLGDFEGYENLLKAVVDFFSTGETPVSDIDTLQVIAFLEAAEKSDGQFVRL